MNRFIISSLLVATSCLLPSCYYDVEEDLYPNLACDTVAVSYINDVLPLLQDNCYSCHNASANFGNVTLEGYNNLKIVVDNGRLLGAIRHEPGFSPMPQNQPQLVTCNIAKIEAWIAAGAMNN